MKASFAIIFFLSLIFWETASAETFQIKPYLFSAKGTGISVAWSYSSTYKGPSNPQVTFKKGASIQTLTPSREGDLFWASLPLPSCDFGSETEYEIPGMARSLKITDIPCAGHSEVTSRFVFMADTQEGTTFAHQFALQASGFQASAVLIGGDLVQNGSEYLEWEAFFDAMSASFSHQVLVPGVGNHEYRHDKDVPFWKYFFRSAARDSFYSVDVGDAHIIVLNSCFTDDPTLSLRQIPWLIHELEKPAQWKIVFFHHPPFSKSIFSSPHYPKKEDLVLQRDYVPLFEKYGVSLVLNGHTHIFERSVKNGINYLTTGPGGGGLGMYGGVYGGKNPYSLMSKRIRTMVEIEASSKALRAVTTSLEGRTIDQFELIK